MLKLEDFFHLPQLDALVEQILADGPGLTVVAGLDPRPTSEPVVSDRFLPSGRSAIFRMSVVSAMPTSSASAARGKGRTGSRVLRVGSWSGTTGRGLSVPRCPRSSASCSTARNSIA